VAETELEALVIKLEADTASFRTELLSSQRAVSDAASKIQSSLEEMSRKGGGSMEKLGDLVEGAFDVFKGGAALVGAIEAVKFALDTVFDAESIRATNAQFELLTSNAGLAGEALRAGLVGAANGLVDDTDLMQTANKALIAMGTTAKDLPAVMELARKAVASGFAKDVGQAFNEMSQAISNGQTRALKNLGIVIDQGEAYKAFAKTLHVSKDELTEAGKQQAIMNAVLATGGDNFKNVDDSIKQNTNSWQQLKVTIAQIEEVATLAFEKIAGPTVRDALRTLGDMAAAAKVSVTAAFGEGTEKAVAQAQLLKENITRVKGELVELEQKKLGHAVDFTPGDTAAKLQALPILLKQYQTQLDELTPAIEKENEAHRQGAEDQNDNAESTRKLSEVKSILVEQGVKLAEKLTLEGPEAIQKRQLELLRIQYEQHKLTVQEFYDAQSAIQKAGLSKQKLQLEAAHNDGILGDTKYYNAVKALDAEYTAKTQGEALKRTKAEQDQFETRLGYTSQFFGSLSQLQKAKSRELYEIGKAAAVAQALVDGFAAVSKTLASVPFPFNIPLAAAAGIAAAANVANIVSAPPPAFAQGGIVPGSSPFGDTTLIRANSGEMVLNGSQQDQLLSLANGGGGSGQQIAILSAILAAIQGKEMQVQVHVGGKVVVDTINDELRSGRRLAI
jgi:hypothetical protein